MKTITQSLINTYTTCPYRYYLTDVRKMTWFSAAENENAGNRFHLAVNRILQGIPAESVLKMEKVDRAQLETWLKTYGKLQADSEVEVSCLLEGSGSTETVLLAGKYDALLIADDTICMYDWKTGKVPSDSEKLRQNPQTRLYCFLAKRLSSHFCGKDIPAENIRIIYSYTERPALPFEFRYSEEAFATDEKWLKETAAAMTLSDVSAFPRSENTKTCRHCPFNSYCGRAPLSRNFEETDENEILQLSFFDSPDDPDYEETVF